MNGKIEIEKISQIYLNKMSKKTKVGVIQLKITKNKEFNLKNSISKIKEAARKGAKIICMPELFLTEYFCKVEKITPILKLQKKFLVLPLIFL